MLNYHLLLYIFEIRLCYKNVYAETLRTAREIFQKEVRLQLGRFSFLHNWKFFHENVDITIKEIKTYFSLELVKTENLSTC